MVRITDELLVSRAEHNDGALATLEEVALHQQKVFLHLRVVHK